MFGRLKLWITSLDDRWMIAALSTGRCNWFTVQMSSAPVSLSRSRPIGFVASSISSRFCAPNSPSAPGYQTFQANCCATTRTTVASDSGGTSSTRSAHMGIEKPSRRIPSAIATATSP